MGLVRMAGGKVVSNFNKLFLLNEKLKQIVSVYCIICHMCDYGSDDGGGGGGQIFAVDIIFTNYFATPQLNVITHFYCPLTIYY